MDSFTWTEIIPTLVTTGALGIIWFDIRRFKADVKKQLYHEDGTTKYIPRAECSERESTYHDHICSKIEEIKVIQKEADNKRESAVAASDSRLRAIEHSLIQLSLVQKIVLSKQGLIKEVDLNDIQINEDINEILK